MFYIIALPLALFGKWKLQGRKHHMKPESEAVVDEWVKQSYCRSQDCMAYTDHNFLQWADEPLVTKECIECGAVSEIWDLV